MMGMVKNISPHTKAILQNLLVTFLWATSWVLIKRGLEEIPALTFAGLRYFLAFLVLLLVFLRSGRRSEIRGMPRSKWMKLILLGFLLYTVAQGAQFVALAYLPAVTVNLVLSFTAILVALLSVILITELPVFLQWVGILLSVGGALVYFYPFGAAASSPVGWIAAVLGVLSNAAATVMGRSTNRTGDLSPLTVTVVTMGIGGTLLLVSGLVFQGLPAISPIQLDDHRLAGGSQHCLRLHPLEHKPAGAFCSRIQHDHQFIDDPDPDPGGGVPGGDIIHQAGPWPGRGPGRNSAGAVEQQQEIILRTGCYGQYFWKCLALPAIFS